MTKTEKEWLKLWNIAHVCPCCFHENGKVQSGDTFHAPCDKNFVTKDGKKADLYWCESCGSAWSIRKDENGNEVLNLEPDEEL